jgi:YggT family protein
MYNFVVIFSRLIDFYEFLIFIWCILSWIPRRGGGIIEDLSQALGKVVRPYLSFFRRFIPPLGMIDFSPIVAMLALEVLRQVVVAILL